MAKAPNAALPDLEAPDGITETDLGQLLSRLAGPMMVHPEFTPVTVCRLLALLGH
jgi:hypothetical protein